MDSLTYFVVDVVKFVLAGSLVFYIAWQIIKSETDKINQSKLVELKKASLETTLPLRLQAYERLALFIERINPSNMLVRVHVAGTTVREIQQFLIAEIRTEHQHNITQQLYVSSQAWSVVNRIKEDTISLINNTAAGLSPEASSLELSKVILTHLAGLEENPYEAGLMLLKHDMQHFF
ncbi:hypothetical protein WG906_15835 [Pedobacter sp. P351]|uniref:DUF7935 family protein n=1 Tax=Pedobacter superstes TaxID=3133441 RepID=UPI0030AB300B